MRRKRATTKDVGGQKEITFCCSETSYYILISGVLSVFTVALKCHDLNTKKVLRKAVPSHLATMSAMSKLPTKVLSLTQQRNIHVFLSIINPPGPQIW